MRPDLDGLMQEMLDRAHPGSNKVRRIDDHTLTVENKDPALTVCDFCGTVPCVREFAARNITQFTVVVGDQRERTDSVGAWGACETCATYIDLGDRNAVLVRAILLVKERVSGNLPKNAPASVKHQAERMIVEGIKSSHAAFWTAKL